MVEQQSKKLTTSTESLAKLETSRPAVGLAGFPRSSKSEIRQHRRLKLGNRNVRKMLRNGNLENERVIYMIL